MRAEEAMTGHAAAPPSPAMKFRRGHIPSGLNPGPRIFRDNLQILFIGAYAAASYGGPEDNRRARGGSVIAGEIRLLNRHMRHDCATIEVVAGTAPKLGEIPLAEAETLVATTESARICGPVEPFPLKDRGR